MTEPLPRRGPLSTIRGWMIAIAGIAVAMGILVVYPPLIIPALLVALEVVAIARFRQLQRRKPMPGWLLAGWLFAFFLAIPVMSFVVGAVALMAYCSMNPDAFNGL